MTSSCMAGSHNSVAVGSGDQCWSLDPLLSAGKHLTYPGYPVLDTELDPGWHGSALQAQTELCGVLPQLHPTLMLSDSDDLSGPWSCLPAKPWLSLVRLYPLGYCLMITKSPPWQVLWFSPQDQYIPPRTCQSFPSTSGGSPGSSGLSGLSGLLSAQAHYTAVLTMLLPTCLSMGRPCSAAFLGFQGHWAQKYYWS